MYVNETEEEHELPDIAFEAVEEAACWLEIIIVGTEASSVYLVCAQLQPPDVQADNGKSGQTTRYREVG